MSSEKEARLKPYRGPVGGWGSVKGVTEIFLREAIPLKGSAVPPPWQDYREPILIVKDCTLSWAVIG